MLQVARLAPTQLGESRDLVAGFLREQLNPDGGFQDRSGTSDLYYTVFGLDGLIALQEQLPVERTRALPAAHSATATISTSCTSPAWLAAGRRCAVLPDARDRRARARARRELSQRRRRLRDEAWTASPAVPTGPFSRSARIRTSDETVPAPDSRARFAAEPARGDGSCGIHPALPSGLTPTTAAAVVVRRHLGASPDRDAGMWLLDRCHASGGFFAATDAPVPDLLSTATALHALSSLHVPLGGIREPCLDFVDSLWTNRGGFFGTWADDAADCEYTYYALLALGHLSLDRS